jgi:hypothetical protein
VFIADFHSNILLMLCTCKRKFDETVAEQIDEFIYVKNPPKRVGGIRVIIRVCVSVSLLTAPFEIHSSLCHCLSIISWSSTKRIICLDL